MHLDERKGKNKNEPNRVRHIRYTWNERQKEKCPANKNHWEKKKKQNAKNNYDTMRNIFYDDLCSWNLFLRGATKKDGIK